MTSINLLRVLDEIEEVMGDRTDVEVIDLDKLTFLTQVRESKLDIVVSLCIFKVLEEVLRLHPHQVPAGTGRQSPSAGMPDSMWLHYIPPGCKDHGTCMLVAHTVNVIYPLARTIFTPCYGILSQISIYTVHRLPVNFDDPMIFDPRKFVPGKPR